MRRRKNDSAASLARFILAVVILAWLFRSAVAAPFNIPSGSMLPTLYIGDYLFVSKWPYGFSRYSFPFGFPAFDSRIFGRLPARGDVVIFRHPTEDSDLVKRVIGLPGDTIEVRNGRIILNGRPIIRKASPAASVPVSPNSPCRAIPPAIPQVIVSREHATCTYRAFVETLPNGPSYTVLDQVDHGIADDYPVVTVPAGHLFLMGDNRDDSLDSRFPTYEGGISMVPTENLIGRASFTFWSTDGSASYFEPWTWFTALRSNRIGNRYAEKAK
jgi:signal peptidase I